MLRSQLLPLCIAVTVWSACSGIALAQTGAPAPEEPAPESKPMPHSIGGMPDPPRGYFEDYTSPLKTLGIGMCAGGYVVNVAASLVYLAVVYPLQSLFGSSKVEPVMLWLFLPIAGPWMAQYEKHVKDQPGWRGVLIADSAIQATGLVVGLIGAALSGRRTRPRERTSQLELHLGVAGLGVTGVTVSLRTL